MRRGDFGDIETTELIEENGGMRWWAASRDERSPDKGGLQKQCEEIEVSFAGQEFFWYFLAEKKYETVDDWKVKQRRKVYRQSWTDKSNLDLPW